jgi:hypothetical protein
MDGYAGAIPLERIEQLAQRSVPACRDAPPASRASCAARALRAVLCPCVASQELLVEVLAGEVARRIGQSRECLASGPQ